MKKRRVGAIAQFKANCRKLKRDRAKGLIADPRPGQPFPMQRAVNEWYVMPPVRGPVLAGPFDTKDEAQAWIDER